jgi:hypothetical protein
MQSLMLNYLKGSERCLQFADSQTTFPAELYFELLCACALLAIAKVTCMEVLVITINALDYLQVFGYPLGHLARVESANCMQRRPW